MNSIIINLPNRLIDTIFNPDATPHDLLLLVSTLAIFWSAVFCILYRILHPFAQRQKWLSEAMGREYDRVGLSMCKALNVNWTRDRYIEIMLGEWPKMQGIYIQHFVGGALCIPAVLGYSDSSWASSLACLGILSEMGWELSDVADIFMTRSTVDGKEKMPNTMVFILMIHHSMTLTLGLPLVLKYRELRELHLMTFNLQWAAAIAISMNEYTKCLDLTQPRQLVSFRILNGLGFVIMAWMRGFQWIYLSAQLMTILYNHEEWTMLFVGMIVCVLITGFNLILCIYPFGKKIIKIGSSSSIASSSKEANDNVEDPSRKMKQIESSASIATASTDVNDSADESSLSDDACT